ncbi:MAG: endospore germination permease [Clostridia bacterium]
MREDISLKQGFAMLFIFLSGGIMAIGGGSEAGRDSYISAILCLVFVIPLYFCYYTPFIMLEKKNFFEILAFAYGEKLGKIVNLIYFMSVFLVAVVSFSRFTLFIKTVALTNTSMVLIGFFMAFTCLFATFNGFEVLARFSEIMLVVVIFSVATFVIISITLFKVVNLQPLLENGVKPMVLGVYSISSMPFMEAFALIAMISQNRKKKDMQKIVFLSAICSSVTIAVIFLRNLLVLGYPAIESLYYPSYLAVSLVSFGDFFERQEVAVSIVFMIADIVKITALSIFLCKSINFSAKTKEYKYYAPAVILLIFSFSIAFFSNTMKLFQFFSIYKYILGAPFVILPVITLLLCKIRCKK